jgi:catechol-2,3-dioxygenase
MRFTQIKETCLYFRDLEKAKGFYHKILGLPVISYVEGKHIFFRAGSSVLLCFNPEDSKQKKSPPAHFADGKYHFAFEVKSEDYLKSKEEMIQKGIIIIDTFTLLAEELAEEEQRQAAQELFLV